VITGILLAAGGARRFGSQKLVAKYRGQPIVRHAARALAAGTDSLIVVTGSREEQVREALKDMPLTFASNADWELGLATSVRRGLQEIDDSCEAIVVAVGDQPQLDARVVRDVIARWRETGKPIVSASYRGVRAHPVLFAREMFDELSRLRGDAGARLLIERSADRVAYVEIDEAIPPDVDTAADLRALGG
jgi:molybdenum cofactor cytidylyltransferase